MTRALYETNVFGPMNVCRAVVPHMRERGQGCIIDVTSPSTTRSARTRS